VADRPPPATRPTRRKGRAIWRFRVTVVDGQIARVPRGDRGHRFVNVLPRSERYAIRIRRSVARVVILRIDRKAASGESVSMKKLVVPEPMSWPSTSWVFGKNALSRSSKATSASNDSRRCRSTATRCRRRAIHAGSSFNFRCRRPRFPPTSRSPQAQHAAPRRSSHLAEIAHEGDRARGDRAPDRTVALEEEHVVAIRNDQDLVVVRRWLRRLLRR
jgi:hypothetical protein